MKLELEDLLEAFPLEFALDAAAEIEWRAVRAIEPDAGSPDSPRAGHAAVRVRQDLGQRTGGVALRVGLERAETATATECPSRGLMSCPT